MRGHEQYAELLGALDERNEDLIAVLEETAVFDVTGADCLPFPDDLDAREELLKEAGKSGLTALDIPKWAMVCVDYFIVHMERIEEEGKAGCKARFILVDDGLFCFCPAAAFIPDDWDGACLMDWEKTDRPLSKEENIEDIGMIVTAVWTGAKWLSSKPGNERDSAACWIGTGQPVDTENR